MSRTEMSRKGPNLPHLSDALTCTKSSTNSMKEYLEGIYVYQKE